MTNHPYACIFLLILVAWTGFGWWVSSRTFDYPVALGWKILIALFWPLFL